MAIGYPLLVNMFNKSAEISLPKYRGIREGLFILKINASNPQFYNIENSLYIPKVLIFLCFLNIIL